MPIRQPGRLAKNSSTLPRLSFLLSVVLAARGDTVDLKAALCDVEADDGRGCHGRLPRSWWVQRSHAGTSMPSAGGVHVIIRQLWCELRSSAVTLPRLWLDAPLLVNLSERLLRLPLRLSRRRIPALRESAAILPPAQPSPDFPARASPAACHSGPPPNPAFSNVTSNSSINPHNTRCAV